MDPSLSHLISWAESTRGDVPLALTGPSLTLSPLGAPHPPTVFLYGGRFVQSRRLSSEMWAIDLASRVWERVDAGEGPAPRYFHTMDVWEDKLVCFGGMSELEPHMSVHDDIWFFDCARRQWLPQPQPEHGLQDPTLLPSARYAHLSAVSRGKLVVSGGQHSDNSWIYEINVYDLKRKVWVSKTDQPERQGLHSKGAYRSVAASAKHRVITPRKDAKSAHTYSIDEEGEGGEIMCYSNYDFAKVRRELDLFSPLDMASSPPSLSAKHLSPPAFNISDISSRMTGTAQPPGLRFPTGGIVGNHFILCGLYLASTSAAFSVYALNLETLTWRHLEPGILATGSWNRAVIWADKAKLLVFGNQDSDLASDYGRRAVSVDHMAVVSLETFGIYTPPKLEVAPKLQEAGLTMLDENLASDFEVVCDDGRRIKCSKRLLLERWSWFAAQERELKAKAAGVVSDIPVDINDTLLGAFNPARLESTHLTLPEPFPVCVAFVQYFYTLSLSTPLQNRAPVLSALLFLAKQYKIDRLARLVVHALHERLDNTNAVGVYEIATLTGQQNLQVRALNMMHSVKNGSSARSHRQGPPPAYAGEGGSADSPQVPPSSQGVASPSDSNATPTSSHNPNSVPTHQAPLQARSESPTLGLDDDEDASAMLSALDINHPPMPVRSRSTSAPIPPLARLPLPALPNGSSAPQSHSRRGSITSSEATSAAIVTPAESVTGSSIRESSIFPRGSFNGSFDSRGSSSSSHGGQGGQGKPLETLPENPRARAQTQTQSQSLSRNTSTRRDYPLHQHQSDLHSNDSAHASGGPPSAYSSHQAQIIQALSTYQMDGRMPLVPVVHRSPSLNHQSRGHAYTQTQQSGPRHLSVQTQSSSSSIYSEASGNDKNHSSMAMTHAGSSTSEFHISLDSSSSVGMSTLSRIETNSSGSTGASSKKQAKEEKKAIALAEKAARKAAQQERFEALRLQQAKAMAMAKAETQKKAEMEAAQPAKPPPEPKGKFGKFGSKFADNVLFGSGGSSNSNSMF